MHLYHFRYLTFINLLFFFYQLNTHTFCLINFFFLTWIKLFKKNVEFTYIEAIDLLVWLRYATRFCGPQMRSLCASDGWGHCILWFKEGQCANSYWHYWCRHFSQRLGVRIVGPPLIDIYKLNFCEVNEPLSSLFTPNSKDRNALNVLYLVCLIIGGNWLNF